MDKKKPLEVGVFVLLHRKLVPTQKEKAWSLAANTLRKKYPESVIKEQIEKWCNGLCGVCEKDCDDEHQHNFQSHRSGEHLEMVLIGAVSDVQGR